MQMYHHVEEKHSMHQHLKVFLIRHELFYSQHHFHLLIYGLKGICHPLSCKFIQKQCCDVQWRNVIAQHKYLLILNWKIYLQKKSFIHTSLLTLRSLPFISRPTFCVGFWKWNGQISALSYLHILNCSNKTPFLALVSF